LSGKRIFITGIAGFLGSHIAERCLAEGYLVAGCDNLMGGYLDNVPGGALFHQIDCNDFASLAPLLKEVDIVYHCAATAYGGLFSSPTKELVNYRIIGDRYVVDQVIDRAALITGVGRNQVEVIIERRGN